LVDIKCRFCGSESYREKPHYLHGAGLYCTECGKFIKWKGKGNKKKRRNIKFTHELERERRRIARVFVDSIARILGRIIDKKGTLVYQSKAERRMYVRLMKLLRKYDLSLSKFEKMGIYFPIYSEQLNDIIYLASSDREAKILREHGKIPYTARELSILLQTEPTKKELIKLHGLKKKFKGEFVLGEKEAEELFAGRSDREVPVEEFKKYPDLTDFPYIAGNRTKTNPDEIGSRIRKLSMIKKQIANCRRCRLCDKRTKPVPGEGNPMSYIMFIGEAPGEQEDASGSPFVGRAGLVLDAMINYMGLKRKQVFITNIIKCRPPNNRNPLDDEVKTCKRYLKQQIAVLDPALIVTLGKSALQWFFPGESVKSARGKIKMFGKRAIFPTFHPAATLYNKELEEKLREDFRTLMLWYQRERGVENIR